MKAVEHVYTLKCPWRPVINRVDAQVYTTVNVILGDEITLVDSGQKGFWKEGILPFLKRVNRDPHDVSLILHTHSHLDHVEADEEIQEATGAKVAISEAGAEALENPQTTREKRLKLFNHLLSDSEREEQRRGLSQPPKPRRVDRMLKNHEILDLGSLSLECISIRGHSRDGMGFYDYDNEVLFSGDAVDGRGTVRDAFIIITDVPGFYESMEMLNELDVKVLLPGHNYLPYQRAILRKALAKSLITHTLAINNEIKEMIIQNFMIL